MLEPLKKCTNPVHEFTLFNALIVIQFANDIWALTKKNDNQTTIYFGFTKTKSNEYSSKLYELIIWRLSIKFGFFNK